MPTLSSTAIPPSVDRNPFIFAKTGKKAEFDKQQYISNYRKSRLVQVNKINNRIMERPTYSRSWSSHGGLCAL
jgi:hypothetical protein